MRILSQDGRIDVPYDATSLSIWDNHDSEVRKFRIYAHIRNQDGSPCILAVYSTAEKARKAMEMLRKAYSPLLIIKDFGSVVEAEIKPNDWEISRTEPNGTRENFYFQFPADDEIEV